MPGRVRPVWLTHGPAGVEAVAFAKPFAVYPTTRPRRILEDCGFREPGGPYVYRLNPDQVASARRRGRWRFIDEARRVLR